MKEDELAAELYEKIKSSPSDNYAVNLTIDQIVKIKENPSINERLFRSALNRLLQRRQEAVSNAQALMNIKTVSDLLKNEEKDANALYNAIIVADTKEEAGDIYRSGINSVQNKDMVKSILGEYLGIQFSSWQDFKMSINVQAVKAILEEE